MPFLGAQANVINSHQNVSGMLSESTLASIDRLVDVMIAAEHGGDSEATVGFLRSAAHVRLYRDLLDSSRDLTGEIEAYAAIVLRSLVHNRMVARQCQCKSVFPLGCPHGTPVDARWCGEHVDADAHVIYGAVLCPTCYAHVVVSQWA